MLKPAQVHFSLRSDDLVIRAQRKDTKDILELVPPENLKGDLPTFLIKEHVHWLDLSTSVIEIRPLEKLWEQSPRNWRIAGEHGKYQVYKDCEFLVGMQSRTWVMISSLLEGLDLPENLVVTTSTNDSSPTPRLSVALPLHGLSFFVNRDGDLESDDFKEMVYDENQGIGTLFGLVNQLVLRKKGKVEEGLVPRCVLVPYAPFKTSNEGPLQPFTYYVYEVDTELGCLTGNFSLESKEFLSYLHAKTSIDWRPDPLTGRTGAQQALSIVQSAGYQSLWRFDSRNSLRHFYVYSKDISPWYPQISIAGGEKSRFYARKCLPADLKGDFHFMCSAGRAAYLFPPWHDGTPTSPGDMFDLHYVSSPLDPELEDIVYTAAFVVYHRPTDVVTTNTISNWAEMWGNIMSGDTTHSPSPHDGFGELWNPNLPQILSIEVHNILRECNDGTSQRFQLLFLLPTLAYCSSHPQTAFLSILLAFAKKGQYHLVNYPDYKLLDGCSPTEKVLRHRIHSAGGYISLRANAVVECLLRAWPTDAVPTFSLDDKIRDVASLTHTLQALFSSCDRNLKRKKDLMHVLRGPQPASLPCAVPYLQYMLGESSDAHPRISLSNSIQTFSATSYHRKSDLPSVSSPASSLQHIPERSLWRVTLDQLLSDSKRRAPALPCLTKLPPLNSDIDRCSSPDPPGFGRLLSSLRIDEGDSQFQAQYITDLHASARHVREEYETTRGMMKRYPIDELRKHFVQCRDKYMDAFCLLKKSLGSTADPLGQALARGGQWPQITADTLLRRLASTSPILSGSWKECLVSFGLLLLEFQRARRLLRFASEGLEEEFGKELENERCDGWNPEQYPDWLLIQVRFRSPTTCVYSIGRVRHPTCSA